MWEELRKISVGDCKKSRTYYHIVSVILDLQQFNQRILSETS